MDIQIMQLHVLLKLLCVYEPVFAFIYVMCAQGYVYALFCFYMGVITSLENDRGA